MPMIARRSFATPNPLASLQQARRYYGMDVPDLSDGELNEELTFLRAHTWPLQHDDWRRERVRMLTTEYNRRKAGSRN